ncbi:META domain-containing protein [Marimonas sp. MJW-29]|uniref:META domain-containing protein n=1 Tax=Sulfitobacter sediminis TaxID=3234186 RepID=A0ABV3RHJ3_9RHOB
MKRARYLSLWLPAALMLAACFGDETLYSYGAAGKTWRLVELRDAPFTSGATLTFPEPGRISGQAPCNLFNATQEAPYPWFATGPIAATRMACPDLEDERAFLDALAAASLSEVLGDTLILSNDDGVLLTFKSDG